MKDSILGDINNEFNEKLEKLDSSSDAVTAYLGLLKLQRGLLHIRKQFGENSNQEEDFKEGFRHIAEKRFPEKNFATFSDAFETVEQLAKPAIDLNNQYKNAIKNYYISSGLELNAVRVLPPDKMDGRIPLSKGLLSAFEEEQGDWVFASSTPKERNPYLARCQGSGMLGMGNDLYYYPNSSIHFNDGRLFIEPKGYIYYMRPDDFTPVTTVRRNSSGTPFFVFIEEWTCPHDISLETDVTRVEEYSDVTFLLENLQLFIGSNKETTSALYSSQRKG